VVFSCLLQVDFPCSGCGSSCGIHTTASGTLTDGSGSYPNYASCKWMIAPRAVTSITLAFSSLSTEKDADYVYVYQCSDANCGSAELIARLSGSSTSVLMTYTGYMLVWFKSDFALTYEGFTASWTSSMLSPPVSNSQECSVNAPALKFSHRLCSCMVTNLCCVCLAGWRHVHWVWITVWGTGQCKWHCN
jgi:hypothetical protein